MMNEPKRYRCLRTCGHEYTALASDIQEHCPNCGYAADPVPGEYVWFPTADSKTRKARALLNQIFLQQPRATGRTYQLIKGLELADRPVVCFCHSHHFASHLKVLVNNKNVTFLTLDQVDQLRGRRDPVTADHVVIETLLREAF